MGSWGESVFWGGTPRARRQGAAGAAGRSQYEKSDVPVRAPRAQGEVPRFLEVTPQETEVLGRRGREQ